jgi:UDP-N-acetylglucosamine diphosphorylase / glucose-1-phosphate thymidylyltransferase / UDP-N-acetylgalactosamine diphosphorylase / glucosamine-1-phosphate N-acetyltransferase / galactosamine-1-phosphate N-acetyltransferase
MKTFLLLAGRSTRFWPLTDKTLFPVCGKTLLQHQVERLTKAGCTDITLVGGAHNLEGAKSIYPDIPTVEQENLDLGMRGAVLSILKAYSTDPLMIVSGNDVVDPAIYTSLLNTQDDGAILAYEVEKYFPGGYLTVDGDRITGIKEKPGEGNEPSNLINLVGHVHKDPAALLEALQNVDESTDDGYEQALAKLFTSHTYTAVPYSGPWQAVKYPWHLLDLSDLLLSEITEQSIHSSADIHPSADIIGDVVIEEGARVLHNAVVRGPAYIGKNTIVANNALVRGSSIGDNCVVGFSTEVKSSVLHSDVWTHMNYLGESVVGSNVSFGAGTVTGNLRLDEEEIFSTVKDEKINTGKTKFGTVVGDDCRIGIHVSINPGIKIGSGTFISSKTLIASDVPSDSFAVMKNGVTELKKNTAKLSTSDDREKFKKKV